MLEIDYRHSRREMSSRVKDAVQHHPLTELAGSWARGEFHLCKQSGHSLSDVDIVCIAPSDQWLAIRQAVERDLRPFEATKVSIHPPASFVGLLLQDGYMLNISEYVCSQYFAAGSEARSYYRAKLVLRLCRFSDVESLSDTAQRLGSAVAMQALRVKLGLSHHFSRNAAEELLASQPNLSPARRSLAFRVLHRVRREEVVDVALGLERCSSMPEWLRTYQHAKLNRLVSAKISVCHDCLL
jgi:hypothetical protein